MDFNCQSELQPSINNNNSDISNHYNKDESTKSPIENRNLKHFKKSMIVEYESGINDDSHSSSSSSSSSSTRSSGSSSSLSSSRSSNEHLATSSSNNTIIHSASNDDKKKAKLDDLYENERSNDDDDEDDDDDDDFETDDDNNNFRSNKKKKLSKSNTSSNATSDTATNQSDMESSEMKKIKKKKKKNKSKESKLPPNKTSKITNISDNNTKKDAATSIHKKKTYCICKSSDSQRFMIACDNCDEWYHGDCVGVTLSLSKKIRTFYCHICRHKKRSLSIKYKSKFQDFLKTYSKSSQQHDKQTSQDESLIKFLKETKMREKKEIELNRKPGCEKQLDPKSTSQHHHDNKQKQKIKVENSSTSATCSSTSKTPISTSSSTTTTTTGFNFENSPNRLYGKSNISGEDFENFFSAITKLGHDAAQLAATKAANSNESSTTNEMNVTIKNEAIITSTTMNYSETDHENYNEENNSNSSELLLSKQYLNNSDFDHKKHIKANKSDINKKSKLNKTNKSSSSKNQNVKRIGAKNSKQQKQQQNQCQKRRQRTLSTSIKLGNDNDNNNANNNSNNNVTNSDDETFAELLQKKAKIQEPIQCYGPECVNEAQQDSKYCSTECGMKLAKNRLVHFLKTRIEQYNETPCYSNILNQNELDRINSEIEMLRRTLTDLEQKHLDLDKIIEKAKFKKINPNIEKERENLESNEIEVYCVTCGNLCTEKIALKHMEKCFNKVESQAFFGSYFKTRIDGQSMFCDYYNPQTKMYCKRLKCICPEHEKEKKVDENEVCGCPLNNLFAYSENEICLASKRNCSLHFKWEKMRRAHIDLEKLRTWLKLEELIEQKRMNETSLNQRAGLLSLLLHQTNSSTSSSSSLAGQRIQQEN